MNNIILPKKQTKEHQTVTFAWEADKVKRLKAVANQQGYEYYTQVIKDVLEQIIQ